VTEPFDLSSTYIHLGSNSTAMPLPDFQWTKEYLESYAARIAGDGTEGRLVAIIAQRETWDSWERHPQGAEVVVLLSGRVDLIQEIDGAEVIVALHPGQAAINPTNVWHRSVVHEPGDALFITPGAGTEHRPYSP
jgi:mannose-6-phosphate isomerase-like protein (cupin superfamily)